MKNKYSKPQILLLNYPIYNVEGEENDQNIQQNEGGFDVNYFGPGSMGTVSGEDMQETLPG